MVRLPFSPVAVASSFGKGSYSPFSRYESAELSHRRKEASAIPHSSHDVYGDCTTIDWNREYGKERSRIVDLQSRPGVEAAYERVWNTAVPWIVIAVRATRGRRSSKIGLADFMFVS